jgi:hypothetical protein
MDPVATLIYAVAVLVTLEVVAVSLRRNSDSRTRARRARRSA